MRILITGGSGYLGSSLAPEISRSLPEAELILMDIVSPSLEGLCTFPSKFCFVPADILQFNFDSLGLTGSDFVIHLAALTNTVESISRPEDYRQVNSEGTRRIALSCANSGTALFFPSTTSVYGSKGKIAPQNPYSESKWQAEEVLRDLGCREGLRYSIGRFGSIFGFSPNMHFHTAIHKFCRQAILSEPITVWETALNQIRPYLELKDCLRSIEFVINTNHFERQAYDIFSEQVSVQEIVKHIEHGVPDLRIHRVRDILMNSDSYSLETSPFLKLGFRFEGSLQQSIPDILSRLAQHYKTIPSSAVV